MRSEFATWWSKQQRMTRPEGARRSSAAPAIGGRQKEARGMRLIQVRRSLISRCASVLQNCRSRGKSASRQKDVAAENSPGVIDLAISRKSSDARAETTGDRGAPILRGNDSPGGVVKNSRRARRLAPMKFVQIFRSPRLSAREMHHY